MGTIPMFIHHLHLIAKTIFYPDNTYFLIFVNEAAPVKLYYENSNKSLDTLIQSWPHFNSLHLFSGKSNSNRGQPLTLLHSEKTERWYTAIYYIVK